jgi:hypothetical protein
MADTNPYHSPHTHMVDATLQTFTSRAISPSEEPSGRERRGWPPLARPTLETLSRAHHEAGQAVIAQRLGAPVEQVSLNGPRSEKGGEVGAAGLPLVSRLVISAAGPLAEIKYLARKAALRPLCFDLSRIEELASIACEGQAEASRPVFHFSSEGEPFDFEPTHFDLISEFVDTNRQQFCAVLEETMKLLDSRQNWAAVQEVAHELAVHGTVSGHRFVELARAR